MGTQVLFLREGSQARPKAVDLRSTPAGVRGFESHPSHSGCGITGNRKKLTSCHALLCCPLRFYRRILDRNRKRLRVLAADLHCIRSRLRERVRKERICLRIPTRKHLLRVDQRTVDEQLRRKERIPVRGRDSFVVEPVPNTHRHARIEVRIAALVTATACTSAGRGICIFPGVLFSVGGGGRRGDASSGSTFRSASTTPLATSRIAFRNSRLEMNPCRVVLGPSPVARPVR